MRVHDLAAVQSRDKHERRPADIAEAQHVERAAVGGMADARVLQPRVLVAQARQLGRILLVVAEPARPPAGVAHAPAEDVAWQHPLVARAVHATGLLPRLKEVQRDDAPLPHRLLNRPRMLQCVVAREDPAARIRHEALEVAEAPEREDRPLEVHVVPGDHVADAAAAEEIVLGHYLQERAVVAGALLERQASRVCVVIKRGDDRATAAGEGLKRLPVHARAQFRVLAGNHREGGAVEAIRSDHALRIERAQFLLDAAADVRDERDRLPGGGDGADGRSVGRSA